MDRSGNVASSKLALVGAFGATMLLACVSGCSSEDVVEVVSDASADATDESRPSRPQGDAAVDGTVTDAGTQTDGRPAEEFDAFIADVAIDSSDPRLVNGPDLAPCSNAANQRGAIYFDLTDSGTTEHVEWNNKSVPPERAFQISNYRCIKVKVGQTFRWDWDGENDLVGFHRMISNGGTSPSFVDTASASATKIEATFTAPGTYGYTCQPHPFAMSGVVWVVP